MASVRMRNLRGKRSTGRRGSVLTGTLIAFLIAMMMVPLCMACIAPLRSVFEFETEVQDEIAAMQLRRVMFLAYDIEADSSSLYFTAQNRPMELTRTNRHVILKPGTQIYFPDVDECSFAEADGLVWIIYERNSKEYRKVLARMP